MNLEKLTVQQLIKKFAEVYETEVSIWHSQEPAACVYPEPGESSPKPSILFLRYM
jgi:hypothetical protein